MNRNIIIPASIVIIVTAFIVIYYSLDSSSTISPTGLFNPNITNHHEDEGSSREYERDGTIGRIVQFAEGKKGRNSTGASATENTNTEGNIIPGFLNDNKFEDDEIEIVLKGRVLSTGSSEPVEGANIGILSVNIEGTSKAWPEISSGTSYRKKPKSIKSDKTGSFTISRRINKDLVGKIKLEVVAIVINNPKYSFGFGNRIVHINQRITKFTVLINGAASFSGRIINEKSIGINDIMISLRPDTSHVGSNKGHGLLEKSAELFSRRKPDSWKAKAVTDSNGEFEFSNIMPGRYIVCVNNNQNGYSFIRLEGTFHLSDCDRLAPNMSGGLIQKGTTANIVFLGKKVPVQSIRVVDNNKNPIKGVFCHMSPYPSSNEKQINALPSYTNENGVAEIHMSMTVRFGYPYRLIMVKNGYESTYHDVKYSGNATIEIELSKPGKELSGIIIDEYGMPLEGVSVKLSYDLNEKYNGMLIVNSLKHRFS